MDEIKLKSCPFCGGKAELLRCLRREKSLTYTVSCGKGGCMAHISWCPSEAAAVKAWNRAEQYEMQLRTRGTPVRYIRAADRRTDRRPPVHHIRSALPNMNRDRRKKREGD